jgi:hypothetical protein
VGRDKNMTEEKLKQLEEEYNREDLEIRELWNELVKERK